MIKRHLSPALVISILALVVSLAGNAYAAIVITGANIKDDTVTSADIHNGSLGVIDLSPAARAALRGATGPVGPAGPSGPAGLAGANGTNGINGINGSPDTPAQVLEKLRTVDGTGSGLDSDLIDGQNLPGIITF